MTTYPGNASLAAAVKERVVLTFQQALQLYRSGKSDEAAAGCTLVLQMDPAFEPARSLLEQTRSATGGVAAQTGDTLREAREALASRDFQRVVQLTTDVLQNDLTNEQAMALADEAREKIEAEPFVRQFLKKCEQHIARGDVSGAKAELEKARALDGSHPGIMKIQQSLTGGKKDPAPARVDASSFVVDSPRPAAGRGTAQAADFGFTFEEESSAGAQAPPAPAPSQPPGFGSFSFDNPTASQAPDAPFAGGFSFDTPVSASPQPSFDFGSPAKASATGEFDFSTASIETTPDDQKKIDQYLDDGDRAFEAGEFQQAIDLWSRVFLIDVTNDEASERIERAKILRREAEQKLDSLLAEGIAAVESRDVATARARFEEVLQLDPSNSVAQENLDKLSKPAAPPEPVPQPSHKAPAPVIDEAMMDEQHDSGEFMRPLVPPDLSPATPVVRKQAAKASRRTSKSRLPVIPILVALVVLAAGGWFVWSKYFSHPSADPAAARAVITRATLLAQQGKYDQAILLLQDIKPGDPQYDSALSLIADMQQKKSKAAAMIDGRPAAAFYEEKISAARAAMDAHDFVGAKAAFEQATRVKPLPNDLRPLYDSAAQQVAKLDTARMLFAERKYGDVIASLQPMLQEDPQNKNIQRMMQNAHFNLGTVALREERLTDAQREFDEVLKADPNDELARRSKELALRYDGQPRDLLYKIYVKYLPLRQPAA